MLNEPHTLRITTPGSLVPDDPVARNIQAMVDIAREARDERTTIGRLADSVARGAGTMGFISFHAVWFAAWIGVNATHFAFDPFPYSLLNMIVALEAVFLTSVVLMNQKDMTRLTDRRMNLDLQVNLLAEQELTAMLRMLHGLCTQAGVHVAIRDERVQQLLAETDIHQIVVALDRELDTPLDGSPGRSPTA